MPNPRGENGQHYVPGVPVETAYGAVKRLEESTKAVPIGPTPGMNAPKRSQRRAVRGQQPQQPMPAPAEQQILERPPTPREVWAAVAQVPGISPLVQEFLSDAG